MKKLIIIYIALFIPACTGDGKRFEYYQPANPPIGVEMIKIESVDLKGDYLLVFRSQNESNNRFDGFLIFIDPNQKILGEIQNIKYEDLNFTESEAFTKYIKESTDYILGSISMDRTLDDEPDTNNYNLGLDAEVCILFSNQIFEQDNENNNSTSVDSINIGDRNYSVTTERMKEKINTGSYIIVMAYLLKEWDNFGISKLITGVSNPSIPVLIK